MAMDAMGWSSLGSAAASLMFLWAVTSQYFPHGLHMYLHKYIDKIWSFVYPYVEITFKEYSGERMKRSEVYASIQTYLSATTAKQAKRLTADVVKDGKDLVLSLDDFQQVTDHFRGIKFWWSSRKSTSQRSVISWYPAQEDPRFYRLTVHRKHRLVVTDYLQHVRDKGKEIEVKSRQRKLYTNNPTSNWYGYKSSVWSHVVFEHPATFDTLAMEPRKKEEILQELESFRRGKDFYRKIGKAWKRGYLLYGPPGTGKSTMIAAMANYLDYDIYDVELTAVKDNAALRKLLIETTAKSLIVIEDIDCSEDLSGERKKKVEIPEADQTENPPPPGPGKKEENNISKVTLSGLLNFVDGLWSSCGGERIIVFTTNHVEKLDPALIRKGRMDKHIELSYCCFETFKVLARNYLSIDSHPLFETVRELLGECKITPADVAENLMPKSTTAVESSIQRCLESLIEDLQKAKEEAVIQAEENSKEKSEAEATITKEGSSKEMSNGIENGVSLTDGTKDEGNNSKMNGKL
ncbi:AAA-ATPase ASD, mitochondrial-like [Aristolochia californica]|uniref:AAA-ATPase ASD, mitochondrial-like n=1 Tax=Aristolochia californica TaxID=171875 RepID=UPI0035D93C3A